LPDKLIIAASSQNRSTVEYLNTVTRNLPFVTEILPTSGPLYAGSNRNRGLKKSTSDYVTFCDADDSFSKKRLQVLLQIAEEFDPDLILHNYSRLKPLIYLNSLNFTDDLITQNDLHHSTFPNGLRKREQETGIGGDTNLILPPYAKSGWRIAHGSATVKTSINLEYGDMPFGEDGQFCRDILFSGKKVCYTPNKLTNYERPTILNLSKKSFLRAHADLAKLKNLMKWYRKV
jgi:glycosyltransferase involved in cell wall biosynthesis